MNESIAKLLADVAYNVEHGNGEPGHNAASIRAAARQLEAELAELRRDLRDSHRGKGLTDHAIREIMLANGFTIKEGLDDLKPYVYQAVRAVLKAANL